ncbi:MAG: hypothetical protein U9N51_09005 [Bacteroidota bacterium]|nr:hypothetical protein [Bacteroidota bacterium]
MKQLKLTFAVLTISAMLISCGSKDKKESVLEKVNEIAKQVEESVETELDAPATNENPDFNDMAMKGLKAYDTQDLETMKSIAFMASAINMDEAFMQQRNERYMQSWDGEIYEIRFRSDMGMKQALAYYADVPDSENDEIYIYIVQQYGDKWYSSSEFDVLSRADFEALAEDCEAL